jgi:protein translocase SEC61 complex gamma subunit
MEENKEIVEKPKEPVKQEPVRQEKPRKPGIFSRLKDKLLQYRRTLDIARKPDKNEYISSLKIITIGMAIVGAIGFVIFLLFRMIT